MAIKVLLPTPLWEEAMNAVNNSEIKITLEKNNSVFLLSKYFSPSVGITKGIKIGFLPLENRHIHILDILMSNLSLAQLYYHTQFSKHYILVIINPITILSNSYEIYS